MPVLDGIILKSKGGPFYPTLQTNLDRLVGMGVVTCTTGASNSYWRITDFGRSYLEEHGEVLSLLLGGRVSYSLRVDALGRTRRPVPTRTRVTSALAFEELFDRDRSPVSAVTANEVDGTANKGDKDDDQEAR